MARYRGRKALYEVMSEIRLKAGNGKALEKLHPQTTRQDKPVTENSPVVIEPKTTTPWWKKPRIVQFNSGRIELSVPYQIAVAVVLSLVLLLLLCFWLGQHSGSSALPKQGAVERASGNNAPASPATRSGVNTARSAEAAAAGGTAAVSTGSQVIVLAQFRARADLVPVQQYFEQNGIKTEIVPKNGRYYLRTTARYVENPSTPGTEGYKVKMRIAELGKKYKAPTGLETFAPNYFSDAYGEKIN